MGWVLGVLRAESSLEKYSAAVLVGEMVLLAASGLGVFRGGEADC